MSDFEYDNEFDAIEDQNEVEEHKKKPVSKEAPKNSVYTRKRDTNDSYDQFEPIDQLEEDEKPVVNTKKPQPLASINNKPDLKSNRAEESKPKVEAQKPKVEEKANPKPTLSTEPKKSETKIKEEAKSRVEEKKVDTGKKNVWEEDDEVQVVEKKDPSPRRQEKPDTGLSGYKKNEKVATEEDEYENVVVEKKPEPKREIFEEIDVKPKKPPISNILESKFDDARLQEGRGPQFDKLKDQNLKLKSELRALAKAADEALQRERANRANKRPANSDDAELKDKMLELKDQLSKIDQLRHQIGIMKRQLENTYNLPKVIEKEDALRAAQRDLNKVTEEKNSLMKIKKDQNKAMDNLNNEGEYDKKLKQVTEELRKAKEDYRKQNEIYLENDKMMKKLHEKIIVMEEKCKELQKKIKDKKNEKPSEQTEEITEEGIQQLEARLDELKEKKANLDKNFDEEMKNLERKKKALQTENQKLAQYLKEKEKEIRLNNLRLKELRKLTKLSQIKLPERELPRKNSLSEGRRTPSGERENEGHSRKQSLGAKKASEDKQLNKVPSKKSQPQPETKKQAPPSTNRDEDDYEDNFEEEVQDMPESSNRVPQKNVEPRAEEAKANYRSTEKLEQHRTSESRSPDVHEKIDDGEEEAEQKGVFSKPSFLKKKR